MIKELTSSTIEEVIASSEYVVIDCYGDFCYACELLEPVYNELAFALPGITFGRINLTQNFDYAEKMQIFDMPTVLFYHNGKLVNQFIGSIDKETFKQYFMEVLY